MKALGASLAVLLACAACPGAPGVNLPRAPLTGTVDTGDDYKRWLDAARTPSRAVALVRSQSGALREVDLHDTTAARIAAGDRLLFVNSERTALLVTVGREPLATAGARLIGAHIDTPSPRLVTRSLSRKGQPRIALDRYGGMRRHHWPGMAVAVVGRVAPVEGPEIEVSLGLDDDDFGFVVERRGSRMTLVTSTTPTSARKGYTPRTFVDLLHERYRLTAADLEAAELYVVPRHRAREVGLDGDLIGAHGHDDRVNSYAAWRAIIDLADAPRATAMVWLVDREEIGSTGRAGADARFLELVMAWLLRAQGNAVTEAVMHRAMSASVALSADTPAAINPNFPEVHEPKNAPLLGNGPALFPFTGGKGKRGGGAASAELIASVVDSFARTGAALQHGVLGANDKGGGGTIAQYLSQRGIATVDVGVPVVSMHSPMELVSRQDIWAAYRGFRAWLAE